MYLNYIYIITNNPFPPTNKPGGHYACQHVPTGKRVHSVPTPTLLPNKTKHIPSTTTYTIR
jgi:hypothetical protein